ncbi:MAG: DUF6106 family protein [Lachnospiraceae bacterium]|nr:DUF6106 family protein [Lachnospiraceae bacterium]
MNETYAECMIKRKPNAVMKVLKYVMFMLAGFFILIGFLGVILSLIIGVIVLIAAYFVSLNSEIEYEYLYVDRQLTIDKIMNRSRRKRVAKYDLERMEILAPFNSYRLDSYKNRTPKIVDYSSGTINQPDTRFLMFIDGTQKVIFEPNQEMIKAISMIAPRKVFKD